MKISLSDEDRARLESYRRGKLFGSSAALPKHHSPLLSKTRVEKARKARTAPLPSDEAAIRPAFDLLIEGTRRGSQADRDAAESLLKAAKHKSVSMQFYDECLSRLADACNEFDRVRGESVVFKMTSKIVESLHDRTGSLDKATQKILFPFPLK